MIQISICVGFKNTSWLMKYTWFSFAQFWLYSPFFTEKETSQMLTTFSSLAVLKVVMWQLSVQPVTKMLSK